MSVFTNLLLLVTCLSMLADGAPNKKNEKRFQSHSQLRPRNISPNPTQDTRCPSLTASDSSRAPLSSIFATGSGWNVLPSGTANTGASFGSSRVVPYPTNGAPYQNSTSLYTKQGSGVDENAQSGSEIQCPPQQTVTLPPQTITLPAQIVTITPTPETITITPQAQTETLTVTVTPQTQTTTVTVWMTVTANQAPSCPCPSPSNAANPQITPVPAQNAQPSIAPVAPVSNNASTPVIAPPVVTTPNFVVSLSTGDAVPIANATSPVIPNLGPTPTATGPTNLPANHQISPVVPQTSSSFIAPIITSNQIIAPFPYRNTSHQKLHFGSGSSHGFRPTGSGFAKPTNRHVSSYFVSKFVTDTPISTTTVGPPLTRGYLLGNVSSLLTPPAQANATVFQPTAGPTAPPSSTRAYFPDEYFPDDGSSLLMPPSQANATTSPTREYFPDDGSSLQTRPAQANATSVRAMGRATAPIITPAVASSSQTLAMVVGSVTPPIIQYNISTSIPPVSTPIPPPSPPIVQQSTAILLPPSTSSSQTPQPPATATPPICINGTTAQNITTDFSELPPIPSMPLILQGLNYTTFTPFTTPASNSNPTSPLPPPTHLLALSTSQPKQIALAPNTLSFSLTSLSLSCGDASSQMTANCTVQMFGIGAASAGSGTSTGTERAVTMGPGMQALEMEGGWRGLSKVSFTAEMGGVQIGVGLGEVVYELVSAC